jgi:hypothetical protein
MDKENIRNQYVKLNRPNQSEDAHNKKMTTEYIPNYLEQSETIMTNPWLQINTGKLGRQIILTKLQRQKCKYVLRKKRNPSKNLNKVTVYLQFPLQRW